MDRFAMRLSLGYVSLEAEVAILSAQEARHPLEGIGACASLDDVIALKAAVRAVRVSAELKRYAVELVRATRVAPQVQLGAGPRASLALVSVAQALALTDGDAFVRPEHVREIAVPVLAHRLVLLPEAKFSGITSAALVEDILKSVPVPA